MRDKNSKVPLLTRYGPGSEGPTKAALDTFWCRACGCNRPVGYLGRHTFGSASEDVRVKCSLGHEAYIVVPIARVKRWEEEAR